MSGLKAIYPGSFDPITNGHLDILDRSLKLFSEITIVVAGSGHKDPLFSPEERIELIREVVRDRQSVQVDRWPGLIMDYSRQHKIPVLIRGLRAASDFEYEYMLAAMNHQINSEVETVFMMTGEASFYISASMVREIASFGRDVSMMAPTPVALALKAHFSSTQV